MEREYNVGHIQTVHLFPSFVRAVGIGTNKHGTCEAQTERGRDLSDAFRRSAVTRGQPPVGLSVSLSVCLSRSASMSRVAIDTRLCCVTRQERDFFLPHTVPRTRAYKKRSVNCEFTFSRTFSPFLATSSREIFAGVRKKSCESPKVSDANRVET